MRSKCIDTYKCAWHKLSSQKVLAIIINCVLNAISEIQDLATVVPSAEDTSLDNAYNLLVPSLDFTYPREAFSYFSYCTKYLILSLSETLSLNMCFLACLYLICQSITLFHFLLCFQDLSYNICAIKK